jgi:hypothetical protein
MADEPQKLICYDLYEYPGIEIVPAPLDRRWMSEAQVRFPYRCLPLNIANQNGWMLLSPCDFSCYWLGGPNKGDIELRFEGQPDNRISTHFGEGVVTFTVPFLFRTSPGINLWVKGPANHIKDGIQPLEGIVESDWITATFTMNWKITRTNEWITFSQYEPFCMLVPIPRGLTEKTEPVRTSLSSNPDLNARYREWEQSRFQFIGKLNARDPETQARGWQKDYFQGKTADGQIEDHQTRLNVKPFPKI